MHGKMEGAWRFFEKGKKISDGHYLADSKHGRWVYYDPTGRVIAEGTFDKEDKTGPWVTFDASARRCEGSMTRGLKTGRWTCYHGPTAETKWAQGEYLNGREHGPWTVWYPDGQIQRTGEYRMGQRSGVWIDTAPDGSRIGEYRYENGVMMEGKRHQP